MPAVAPVPFAPFWGHDDDADPLAGGALYAFAAGTDTPLTTYANPQGTTLNPHPVVLDDAGYAQVYLHSGTPYKLRLVNNVGVQQWEIDQVYGSGAGGGSSLAGVGWGKNTVALSPTNGASQASAAVFPPDVLAFGMTVWVQTGFGASQGVQQIGLGTPTLPDAWGVLDQVALDAASSAGMFLAYSGQPKPESGVVTLCAYGGTFDGTGTLYVTGHFFTLTPGHELGYSYAPGVPDTGQILPPQPPATETERGLIELATAAEVTTGTDAERAVTPFTLTGRLNGRLPAGTALSVPRYSSGGVNLESTPGLLTTTDGRLGIGGAAPPSGVGLQLTGELRVRQGGINHIRDDGAGSYTNATVYSNTLANSYHLQANRAAGTEALPLASPSGQTLLRVSGKGHDGTAFPTDARTWLEFLAAETWTPTAQGTAITFNTTRAGTLTQGERLRIDGQGNLRTAGAVAGTGLTGGLVMAQGTAPTAAHPVDAVQAWVADTGGLPDRAGLHLRTEDGTSHVLGDSVGVGTLCQGVLGSGAVYRRFNVQNGQLFVRQSSLQERATALLDATFVVATDATRTARLALSAYDATAAREGLRLEADGTAARIGFLGAAAAVRQTLPAAATDPATTMALANALRTLLLTFGLGQ